MSSGQLKNLPLNTGISEVKMRTMLDINLQSGNSPHPHTCSNMSDTRKNIKNNSISGHSHLGGSCSLSMTLPTAFPQVRKKAF